MFTDMSKSTGSQSLKQTLPHELCVLRSQRVNCGQNQGSSSYLAWLILYSCSPRHFLLNAATTQNLEAIWCSKALYRLQQSRAEGSSWLYKGHKDTHLFKRSEAS